MKKFLALILALAMALCLVACGQEAAAPAEDAGADAGADAAETEIVVVLKCVTSEYWKTVMAGCEAAGEDLGVKVSVIGPNAESDIEPQVAMIETAIGAGCSAIVCAPNDAGAANGALQAAIDAGIPVLSVDTNCGIAGQTCFVGTMNDVAASQGGLKAIEILGDGATKAAIIYGQDGDNTSNMRRDGYQKACDEKGVEVPDGAVLTGKNTTDGGKQAMESLLEVFGDELSVVFCHNDDTAFGAASACADAGIDSIMIVGFDGNDSAKKNIQSGELPTFKMTIAQQPYVMGYAVIENALKAINGESVDEVVVADVAFITAENVADFL